MGTTNCHACSNAAKYKCPRCSTPSCSLACIRAHKSATSCSGERDPSAYVSAKEYGYQALMNDYTYLENMSRTVGLASKERKDMPLRKETGKLPLWVIEAGRLGLEVTLLGDGMQRRSENKSSWSKNTKSLTLTLTFKLHLSQEETTDLTTPSNPSTSTLAELLKKPMVDGRAAKVLDGDKDKLKRWKEATSTLRFFIRLLQDPRTSDWRPPPKPNKRQPSPPPPPPPPPAPVLPQRVHHSLPMKPNFNLDFSNMRPGQISSGPMSISQQPVQQPGVALPPPSQPVTFPPPELPPIVPAKRPAEEEDRPAPPQSHKIVYAELDRDAPLIDQLKGVHVIEWPVIDVYLDAQQPTSNTLEIELKPIAAAHKSDAPPVLKATKLEASEEKGLGLDAYGSDSETEEQAQEEVVDLLVPR